MTSEGPAPANPLHLVLQVNDAVTDEDFYAAKSALERDFSLDARQRVEFGAELAPHIVIDIKATIDAIIPALVAHGLYDTLVNALLVFVRRPRSLENVFDFAMGEGSNRITAHLVTNDEQALR